MLINVVFDLLSITILATVVMKPYMCLLQLDDTVLHNAAEGGHSNLLQLFISAGMSVDIKGNVS